MSEDPAPYWVSALRPFRVSDGVGWKAGVVWRDGVSGHDLRWESESVYASEPEALLASQEAAGDDALRERLLVEHPRDMEAYWRRRAPWLYEERAPRLRVVLPRRPFAAWERAVVRGDAVSPEPRATMFRKLVASGLRVFGYLWLALLSVLMLASSVAIVVTAPSLWQGWWRLTEIWSPFNVWNLLATAVSVAPGFGALWLAKRLMNGSEP